MTKQNDLSNTTLVLFHGTLQRKNVWDPFAEKLRALGFNRNQILIPDLYHDNPEDLSDWILNISESIKTDFYIPIGYSLGGRFSLDLVSLKPTQLKKIILLATDPGIEQESEREVQLIRDQKWADKFQNTDWDVLLKEWNSLPTFAGQLNRNPPTEIDFDRTILSRLWLLSSKGRNPNRWPELNKITCPGLIITGKLDEKFSTIAKKISKTNPNFSHVELDGIGHRVAWEQPEIAFAEIESFLSE